MRNKPYAGKQPPWGQSASNWYQAHRGHQPMCVCASLSTYFAVAISDGLALLVFPILQLLDVDELVASRT